jgi:hypothetical protein
VAAEDFSWAVAVRSFCNWFRRAISEPLPQP